MIKLEKTMKFYDEIKNMGFFKRLFSWGSIIPLLTESYSEITKLDEISETNNKLTSDLKVAEGTIESLTNTINKHEMKISSLDTEIKHLNQDIKKEESEVAKLEETKEQNTDLISNLKANIRTLEDKRETLTKETKDLSGKISQFEKVKEEQQKKYDETIAKLEKREDTLEKRRQELEDQEVGKETQKFEEMKKTWRNHEIAIEQSIKKICNKYTIDYFDKEKVPFKGKPDNSIKIANEFIIFDAKSPSNDDLNNFPTYIKNQAISVKKYITELDVKKDIFLVVPTNTIDILDTTFYDMSDYRVYVITIDSLEPIILSLRKIEDYEFAEKLSPEDRESICRVLGHFAHHTKRRLQLDTFLANASLDLLKSCEYLPEEILDEVKNHELKTIINVPMDKRSKKSNLEKLIIDTKRLTGEVEPQDINTKQTAKKIESIDLYNKED
ncbi:MAG: hypothetical protein K0B02_04805 [DPANN group archaeon]|nr:hypothetical protein [DPANN group archaeon]